MPIDPDGPHGPLFSFRDGTEFAERYPELSPLAPVADALRMLHEAGEGPDARRNRVERLRAVAEHDLDARDYERERTFSEWMATRHDQWAKQLDNAVERIERFDFRVDPETGRVTVPTGRRGPDVDLLTVAAGMVWDSLDVDGYREQTGDTDAVPEPLAETVAERLCEALQWGWGTERNVGRNSRLRKALRRYVENPGKYQLVVEHSPHNGAADD